MKKLFLFLAILISLVTNAQRKSWTDNIGPSDITGNDTIIWNTTKKFYGPGWGIDVKFHTLDCDSSSISVLISNQDSIFSYADISGPTIFPDTLSVTTYSYLNEYGDSVASRAYQLENLLFKKIGIKYVKGGCTSGQVYWDFKQE